MLAYGTGLSHWYHKSVSGRDKNRCMCGPLEQSYAQLMWNCEHTAELVEQCESRSNNRAEERLLCRIVPLRPTPPSGRSELRHAMLRSRSHLFLQKDGDLFIGTDGSSKNDIATWSLASQSGIR